jgi:hypothetical protein
MLPTEKVVEVKLAWLTVVLSKQQRLVWTLVAV